MISIFYIAFKEDWSSDNLRDRNHYVYDTEDEAKEWLSNKGFYYNERRKEYILEKGFSVAFARIIPLVKRTTKQ